MKPAVLKFAGSILLVVTLVLAIGGTSDEFWLTAWFLAFVFLVIPLVLLSVRDLIATCFQAGGPAFRLWLLLHVCAVFAAVIGYSLGLLAELSGHPKAKWLIVILPALVYVTPLLLWLHGLPFQLLQYLLQTIRGRHEAARRLGAQMSDRSLVPGDRVVHLAALLRSSALLTGAAASAVSLWVLKQSALWTLAAVVLGGAVGFVLGSLLGPVLFLAPAGDVRVVKLGPGALHLALRAGLIGGICSGILAGVVPPLMLSQAPIVAQLVGTGVVIGIVIGAASAYIATRP